jgi:hypothetical protein
MVNQTLKEINIKISHDWKLAVHSMKYLKASLKPPGKFNFTAQ